MTKLLNWTIIVYQNIWNSVTPIVVNAINLKLWQNVRILNPKEFQIPIICVGLQWGGVSTWKVCSQLVYHVWFSNTFILKQIDLTYQKGHSTCLVNKIACSVRDAILWKGMLEFGQCIKHLRNFSLILGMILTCFYGTKLWFPKIKSDLYGIFVYRIKKIKKNITF